MCVVFALPSVDQKKKKDSHKGPHHKQNKVQMLTLPAKALHLLHPYYLPNITET